MPGFSRNSHLLGLLAGRSTTTYRKAARAKGNIKREKDGAPAPKDENKRQAVGYDVTLRLITENIPQSIRALRAAPGSSN